MNYTESTATKELTMVQVTVEEDAIKALVKEAIIELLHERQDLLYAAIAEVIEDRALGEAIREGESTPYVTEDEVLAALEDQA
jgi:hypothetical protein